MFRSDPLGPVPFGGTEADLRAFLSACDRIGQRPAPEGGQTPILPPAAERAGARAAALGPHWSQVMPPAPQDAIRIDDGVDYDPSGGARVGQVDRAQPGWDFLGRAKAVGER